MSFLNPAFLYGLFALAIPIIIHLFHFRKARKVLFSDTRFLQSVKKVSQSKLNLKHYLILASRLLFILFLVLTFAQPFIPAQTGGERAKLVDIYLDNSYSMSNKLEEDLSGLDAAVQGANEILAAYPEGTRFRLLTNGFESSSQYYASKGIISDRLTETTYSAISRSLDEVMDRLKVLPVDLQQQERDVFLISDFQERLDPARALQEKGDSLEQVYLIPLQFEEKQNVYVDTVYLEKPVIFSNSQNTIFVELANNGMQAVEEMPVSLSVNGVQVANTTINIPARGSEKINFQLNFALQPYNKGKISFEEYPVTFDNEFNFVIREAGKVQIVEIKERPEASPVSKVFADTTYFTLRSFQPGNLDFGAIRDADLVVVNGLPSLEENLQAALLSFREDGGSLLLIPGKEGFPPSVGLLAPNISLRPTVIQEPVPLAPVQKENPFFADIFEGEQVKFDMPRAKVLQNWSGSVESILELQTGNSFLGRSGETYLLAAPLEDEFTTFHRHALFVPVMYRIAFNSLELSNSLYQSTEENLVNIQLDNLQPDVVYKLRNGEQELIPNQRISGRNLVMELPSYTLQPGFYELIANGEVRYLLAFNHSPKESQLDQLDEEQLESIASANPKVELVEGIDSKQARAGLEQKFKGQALWKWALLLALLSLLAEVLLIRFWK